MCVEPMKKTGLLFKSNTHDPNYSMSLGKLNLVFFEKRE